MLCSSPIGSGMTEIRILRGSVPPFGSSVTDRPANNPGTHPEEAPVPVLANIIGPELLIVLAVVALLFGGSRLPHLARSLGSAKNEFERGLRDDAAAEKDATR